MASIRSRQRAGTCATPSRDRKDARFDTPPAPPNPSIAPSSTTAQTTAAILTDQLKRLSWPTRVSSGRAFAKRAPWPIEPPQSQVRPATKSYNRFFCETMHALTLHPTRTSTFGRLRSAFGDEQEDPTPRSVSRFDF